MPGGYKNIKPEDANGFDKHPENINKSGRPVSIKKQLKELLLKDGRIAIPKSQFVKETKTDYIFKLPTQQALAMKLITTAMNKNGFAALKLMLETFDGRAMQSIDMSVKDKSLTEERRREIYEEFQNDK